MKDTIGYDVLAVGSALVELTPLQPGCPLVESDGYEALPSGASANFCVGLARLGLRVALATRVGDDELGRWLARRLAGYGVDTHLVHAVGGQLTPVSFCWMDGAGAKTFYFYRFPGYCDPMAEFGAIPLTDADLSAARLLDFSEATIRSEPLRSLCLQAARRARELGVQVCYAVNYRPQAWACTPQEAVSVQREALACADIALMNEEEARLITGREEFAAADIMALGPQVIAVTSGKEGARVFTENTEYFIPPRPVSVCYDVGAGDTFHAGFVAALLRGLKPPDAGRIASCAAALRISRQASLDALPTWDEVAATCAQDG